MSEKKTDLPEEDDGRTIADMSGVEHRSLFGFSPFRRDKYSGLKNEDSPQSADDRPWEDKTLDRSETGHFILGAVGAGLLVGLVFIGAAALFIGLLLLLWN